MNHRETHIVGLLGGLGNQLFQYSFALHLAQGGTNAVFDASALRTGTRKLELEWLIESSCLPRLAWLKSAPYPRGRFGTAGEVIRKLVGPSTVRFEDTYGFPEQHNDDAAWWYGYWQQPSVVASVLPALRASCRQGIIPVELENSIGIHVRRGDYVDNDLLLSPSYYNSTLNKLLRLRGIDPSEVPVKIFSDDPKWCAANLDFDAPVAFQPPKSTQADFLALMACEYLVLSRSTFSWWAAVLPQRDPSHVIAPHPYVPYGELDYLGWEHGVEANEQTA